MPTQSPGVFLVIGFAVLGAVLLLYVLVRMGELCHRLSLRLCRPQYEWLHGEARRYCCCKGRRESSVIELSRADFERDDGTLLTLSSDDEEVVPEEEAGDGQDQDKEARLYQAARRQARDARETRQD